MKDEKVVVFTLGVFGGTEGAFDGFNISTDIGLFMR